jgi:hypothetical protein
MTLPEIEPAHGLQPVDDPVQVTETGTVTRAVPDLFGVIPVHDTTEMRVGSREFVEGSTNNNLLGVPTLVFGSPVVKPSGALWIAWFPAPLSATISYST